MPIKTVITYFEEPGEINTGYVLEIAKKRGLELGIKKILLASRTGSSAIKAIDILNAFELIVVTHSTGFDKPDLQKFTDENRTRIEQGGAYILTTTHLFAGINRAMRNKFDTYVTGDVISNTLRIFGHGMKVACEIAMMAADSGLVNTNEDIISIGGTQHGVDTAIILKPLNSHNFFDLRVREILCKPRF